MDIVDETNKRLDENNVELLVHNPLDEAFTTHWDGTPYTIGSKMSEYFPTYLAEHISKHLTDAYCAKNPKISRSEALSLVMDE